MKVMGVLKTARLLRMLRVARRLDQYSEYGAAVVLLLLMGTFALAGHWLACIFYAIAVIEQSRLQQPIRWIDNLANYTTGGAILTVNDTLTWPDLRSCYITSLYYTFTAISSIGFGNVAAQTTPEKIFAIFAMLIGCECL
jgi:potassium voltage-gated channel Eag-related subfamily H protein 2